MLSKDTLAFGPKIGDRAAWEELGRKPGMHAAIGRAERLLAEPIPPLSDDLFLEFSRTGNRTDYEKVYFNRTGRLAPLVIAECIEHRGRFVPAIEQLVGAFDEQKTWMLPAHDGGPGNFRGEARDIDLFSSALACDLANAAYLLGDSIDAGTRSRIDRNVRRRVLEPFCEMVTGKYKANWWITGKNNWNAVCLANVLGAALASLPDPRDRAVFAAAAEQDSLNYLDGFADDGHCVEGLGYWNYGFGNYIRLCELLYQATGRRVDCFDRDKVKAIAGFPSKLRIAGDVYPAYGDVHLDAQPTPALVDFVDRRFQLPGLDAPGGGELSTSLGGSLGETLMMSCPNSATGMAAVAPEAAALRDWFGDAQVLTCRPAPDGGTNLAVSIKGGRNGVSHGHCDLGSFVLVVGKTSLLVDPGGEVYTARTFSKDRYKSKVINSFGHNVPLVAGQLQISTSMAAVKILHRDFNDSTDSLAMDLTSAYAVGQLTSLHRTFTYDRRGGGTLTIDDECRFSAPASFGIQFITFGNWKRTSANQLLVWQDNQAVRIDLATDGGDLSITSAPIDEDLPGKVRPIHISVDLKSPAANVKLKSVIRSVAVPEP
ncbi:MAG: heparinase II/III family protein [Tepidisphaeraceae bacterium]